jgi:1-deoxyxylulose-5-phosphate synthase
MMSYGDNTDRAWAQGQDVAEPIVRAAVDGGVTFFDTADAYNGGTSEVITGRLLAKMFASRDDYVLATKVYFPTGAGENDRGLSRKHILSAYLHRAVTASGSAMAVSGTALRVQEFDKGRGPVGLPPIG